LPALPITHALQGSAERIRAWRGGKRRRTSRRRTTGFWQFSGACMSVKVGQHAET
jgi:hypothetical protein